MNSRQKYFITGAGGFIGINFVNTLIKENHEIHVLLKTTTNSWRLEQVKNKIHFHKVSLLNFSKLKKALEEISPDVIIHLAANGAYSYQNNLHQIVRTNINGTVNLLLASKNIPYKAFINTGTSSEYGFTNRPMKESDKLTPSSFYAASKASTTYLSQVFAKEFDKPIVTVRPFSIYGPFEEKGRFIPTIMHALITNQPILLTPGIVRRDFVHVNDFVNGTIQLIAHAGQFRGDVFNIGSGKEYSNDEIVETLFKVTKKKVQIKKGEFAQKKWDTSHWVADLHNMVSKTGWRSSYDIESGLLNTYQWFKKNFHLYD